MLRLDRDPYTCGFFNGVLFAILWIIIFEIVVVSMMGDW